MSGRSSLVEKLQNLGVQARCWPPVGHVRWGDLRRLSPAGETPSNRGRQGELVAEFYTRHFFSRHAADIQGNVLELGPGAHALAGAGRIQSVERELVEIKPHERLPLSAGAETSRRFDCILAPHVIQSTFELEDAVQQLQRALRPGGVVLATFPGIAHVPRTLTKQVDHYWGFTAQSVERLFVRSFDAQLTTECFGNVLAAVAALHGIAREELDPSALALHDADYELVIGLRAARPDASLDPGSHADESKPSTSGASRTQPA